MLGEGRNAFCEACHIVGGKTQMAKLMDVTYAFVWRIEKGEINLPLKYGHKIVKATNGVVTLDRLFPDQWRDIWPELKMKKNTKKN